MTPHLGTTLPARHGFFTRHGGVSTGAFASLNCSLPRADAPGADDRDAVLENRARVATAMGVAPEGLLGLRQVHGVAVATVTDAWAIGQGPEADAMVTAAPGLALGIVTADCVPVLFADAGGRAVGAAHAGWKGAVAGVLEATAAAMRDLGATAITAAIGPCIQQPSYEVGADLCHAVLAADAAAARFLIPGKRDGRWQFDLPGYCAARLAAIGIPAISLGRDTCAEEDAFFSHRRRTLRGEPVLGHQISVIRL